MIYLDYNILKDKKSREKFLALNLSLPVVLLSDSKIDIIDGYRYLSSCLIMDVIGNSSIDIENHLKNRIKEENICYHNPKSGNIELISWENYQDIVGPYVDNPYDYLSIRIYSNCDMPNWMKKYRKTL